MEYGDSLVLAEEGGLEAPGRLGAAAGEEATMRAFPKINLTWRVRGDRENRRSRRGKGERRASFLREAADVEGGLQRPG